MRTLLPLLVLAGASPTLAAPQEENRMAEPIAYRVSAKLPDVVEPLDPSQVRLEGYLGARVANNEKNRLLIVNEDELLAGFRHRPGKQDWIGEHVGKFLHAATLAWANSSDPALRAKLDRVVTGLIATQEPDGYLGTYTRDKHWTSWDVWVHKYDLIGLLTYYRYTGNPAAFEAARKIGDLLTHTFGPGKKSIIAAGTHVGMAATSVLEPIVLLYRTTGDEGYLDFARYIVDSWNEPNGPQIIKTLTTEKKVNKTANGKAYEMMSNLVGLCELARVAGERAYLEPVLNAWEDVVAHQRYITGTASRGEHFGPDYDLPNHPAAHIGETCVTVTWIQLNAQLLRLTGDARYGDELERSYLNHLAAAQRPDGAQWCYYTALEGTKPYTGSVNCCLSSGPRGMALAPTLAYLKQREGGHDNIVVNLFETSRATLALGGQQVTVEQQTDFPRQGRSTLTLSLQQPASFGLMVRSPVWAAPLTVRVAGETNEITGPHGGWVKLSPRRWRNGDQVVINFDVSPRVVEGAHGNAGRAALMWGPVVLAYDTSRNAELPAPTAVAVVPADGPGAPASKPVTGRPIVVEARVRTVAGAGPKPATFVPFAEAGAVGSRYQVWMFTPDSLPQNLSLLAAGVESRSRRGNVNGALNDGDVTSFVVTYENSPAAEDWFAVSLDAPATVRRIIFAHGQTFHDGGWFDASGGKPRVQVQREKQGSWETVGTLDEYPTTTASEPRGLKNGQTFTLRLGEPIKVVGVRIIGKPASGDNPQQAFASAAELQAFAD